MVLSHADYLGRIEVCPLLCCTRSSCVLPDYDRGFVPGLDVPFFFEPNHLFGFIYTTSCPNIFRTGCPIRLRDWTWCPFFEPNRLLDFVSTRTWCPHYSHDFLYLGLGVRIVSPTFCVPDLVSVLSLRFFGTSYVLGLSVRIVSSTRLVRTLFAALCPQCLWTSR